MLHITLTNSYCQIENSDRTVDSILRQELRYINDSIEFALFDTRKKIQNLTSAGLSPNSKEIKRLKFIENGLGKKLYVYLYNDGKFPSGLLPRTLRILKNSGFQINVNDIRAIPKLNSIKYILKEPFPVLRDYQKDAVKKIKIQHRGVLSLPTGTGKTLIIARMIWELGLKSIVITPSKAITDHMVHFLTKHFGKGKVGRVTTKTKVLKDISVCNVQSLVRMNPDIFKDVSACFIDEFHHSSSVTYTEINKEHLKNCYYRIGATATNYRNDSSGLGLEGVLSDELFRYDIGDAINNGFLVPLKFCQVDSVINGFYNRFQDEYKKGLVYNASRNDLIREISFHHKDDSVIILVQSIEHGKILLEIIPESVFISGKESEKIRRASLDNFRSGALKCLIGTSVLGEGVDLPIANILILAGGGKSKVQLMQNVGRVLRPYDKKDFSMVYDFTDTGSKWLSKHSRIRVLELSNEFGSSIFLD